jgi:magnesium transporter
MPDSNAKYKIMHHAPGTAPGTLTIPESAVPPEIHLIAYDGEKMTEQAVGRPDDLPALIAAWRVNWVHVAGLGSKEVLERLGQIFDLHPLALEDVLNPYQRPKLEEYGDIAFLIMRMTNIADRKLMVQQLSLFMGKNFVVTFQEKPGDCFDMVRERIRRGAGRPIRTGGPDYLAYALLDSVVDGYFPVLEHYGEAIDKLEDDVIFRPTQQTMEHIHLIKRKLGRMHHAVWPMRELISGFSSRIASVEEQTRLYLRDCYDHIVQVLDLLETDRERTSGLIDVYLSSLSNRMNEIMKVLTIISTIFIPLSFIAGLYGMNFDTSSPYNMPELKWRYGYLYALTLMGGIAIIMLIYFWRKGWLGGKKAQ